jgi:hypothetical protein
MNVLRRHRLRRAAWALAVAGLLGGAAPAGATPSDQQYSNPLVEERPPAVAPNPGPPPSEPVRNAAPAPPAVTKSGTLPFTGTALGVFVGIGGLLLLAGVALRFSARRTP